VPPLEFVLDPSVQPVASETLPLSAIQGSEPGAASFVNNELVVRTNDPAVVEQVASRYGGVKVDEFPVTEPGLVSLHFLRVDPSRGDTGALVQNSLLLDSHATGVHRVSDAAGLGLLAIQQEAIVLGLPATVNWVFEPLQAPNPADIVTGSTTDGFDPGSFGSDAFQWAHMLAFNVPQAWQTMYCADRLNPSINVAVIDGGFASGDTDIPGPQRVLASGDDSPAQFSCPAGPCPYHGQNVAQAGFGILDNGIAAAGPGGPVVSNTKLTSFPTSVESAMITALRGPPHTHIVNFSIGTTVPAIVDAAGLELEIETDYIRKGGRLIYAAAGDSGADIDFTNEFGYEPTRYVPCELSGVICVAGVDNNGILNPGSNFGGEDIDLRAPWTVAAGTVPRTPTVPPGFDFTQIKPFSGTSASSPFAAGVAALTWAANPSNNADRVDWCMRGRGNPAREGACQRTAKRSALRRPLLHSPEARHRLARGWKHIDPRSSVFFAGRGWLLQPFAKDYLVVRQGWLLGGYVRRRVHAHVAHYARRAHHHGLHNHRRYDPNSECSGHCRGGHAAGRDRQPEQGWPHFRRGLGGVVPGARGKRVPGRLQ
jgi:hypothetical protein